MSSQINALIEQLSKGLGVKGDKHYQFKPGEYAFHTVFLPPAFVLPFVGLTLGSVNACLSYASTLQNLTGSFLLVAFTCAYIHLFLYNKYVEFCTETTKKNHVGHGIAMFSAMGATLGFFNLYAYSLEGLYIIGGVVTFFIAFIEYFVCMFQKHHFRTCSKPNSPHAEVGFETPFTVLGVAVFFFLVAYITVGIGMSGDLWDTDRPLDLTDHDGPDWGCTNLTTLS